MRNFATGLGQQQVQKQRKQKVKLVLTRSPKLLRASFLPTKNFTRFRELMKDSGQSWYRLKVIWLLAFTESSEKQSQVMANKTYFKCSSLIKNLLMNALNE